MDIAALSTALATSQIQSEISVALAGKVKDLAEQKGAELIDMLDSTKVMEQSVTPHIGGNIDISK